MKKVDEKQLSENRKTIIYVLLVVIGLILIWWYRSEQGRIKWINELQDQIYEKEAKIEELETEIEGWKEMYEEQ